MKSSWFPALVFGSLLFALPAPARADVPPPNVAQCNKAQEGDACVSDDEKDGACVKDMCTRLDYSDGSPPGTVTEPCLVCKEGAKPTNGGGGCSFGNQASGSSGAWALGALLLLARRRRAR